MSQTPDHFEHLQLPGRSAETLTAHLNFIAKEWCGHAFADSDIETIEGELRVFTHAFPDLQDIRVEQADGNNIERQVHGKTGGTYWTEEVTLATVGTQELRAAFCLVWGELVLLYELRGTSTVR